jgi:hypothetical protein
MLFILYNAESAQHGNGKQYFNPFFKNCLYKAESVLKIHLHLLNWKLLLLLLFRLVSFRYVLYTAIIHKTRPLSVAL